jgi:hypothetical protein
MTSCSPWDSASTVQMNRNVTRPAEGMCVSSNGPTRFTGYGPSFLSSLFHADCAIVLNLGFRIQWAKESNSHVAQKGKEGRVGQEGLHRPHKLIMMCFGFTQFNIVCLEKSALRYSW